MNNPKRGEVWLVQLDPTRGQEIKKTRPAVVISSNLFSSVSVRIIIPVAKWQSKFQNRPCMISIPKTDENSLDNDYAGNVLQVRSIANERFVKYLGQVSNPILEELLAGLIICIDYHVDS
ncbi:type II toxin-antitoxin system PemK/MazF family toxin [Okeania sp. KiyG1]|uniref:type II toxin-antitoxin system PemK/MazF family toxin n=1 Tax=Okeania sp. KiyG1 TaxID=2720165 RepID=UPI001920CCFD|nr:type II toxin-antitoxin system PemK/MazF family toxin [Okeania sp. KiyG1]